MRLFCALLLAGAMLGPPAVAQAASIPDPADARLPYKAWIYPPQLPYGGFEKGASTAPAGSAGFLTLPFAQPRFVTSIFDHCRPDYSYDGRVCRFDGTLATPRNGVDPKFGGGYSARPGGRDYVYYEGHDGIDYGLYYENVLAAADGVVSFAGWDKPGCVKCGYGLNVFINHGNGFLTRYGHLDTLAVGQGESVRRGEVLGRSGNSGSSTGAHLHFGVYRASGMAPIDPYGWRGPAGDPWSGDAGDLWLSGAPRYPDVVAPTVDIGAAQAAEDPSDITVSWSGRAPAEYDIEVVVDDAPPSPWLQRMGAGSAHFQAASGHVYWFLGSAHTDLGWTAAGASRAVDLQAASFPP